MRSRLFDWALLLVLALTIVGSFTAPRQPGRDLLHLSISDLQVTPIAPGDAEPQRAHLTVNWRWDGAPPTAGKHYLLLAADPLFSPRGIPIPDAGLLESLGVWGAWWAVPVEPTPSGSHRYDLIAELPGVVRGHLPVRVYYLYLDKGDTGRPGQSWVKEFSATLPVQP